MTTNHTDPHATIRAAISRAETNSGLLEPIALDDARALVARLDALLDDFQDCQECEGTGIGPVYVDGHGNVGDEPCSACAGLGGLQKSAAQWIAKWHERTNEWKARATAAESEVARLRAEVARLLAGGDAVMPLRKKIREQQQQLAGLNRARAAEREECQKRIRATEERARRVLAEVREPCNHCSHEAERVRGVLQGSLAGAIRLRDSAKTCPGCGSSDVVPYEAGPGYDCRQCRRWFGLSDIARALPALDAPVKDAEVEAAQKAWESRDAYPDDMRAALESFSRAEAVAKARRQGIVEGLIRGAVSLESSAKSQDMAAWESAQRSGMDDFVKAHEATAKVYRAGAESLREQAKWAGEKQ